MSVRVEFSPGNTYAVDSLVVPASGGGADRASLNAAVSAAGAQSSWRDGHASRSA